MSEEFLQDPLSMRHYFEINGATTFPDLLTKKCASIGRVRSAISLMCGSGWQDRIFHSQGLFDNVVGLDDDHDTLETAKVNVGDGPFTYAPLGDAGVSDMQNSVDLVYTYGQLGRCLSPRSAVTFAHASLKPGGVLAVLGRTKSRSSPNERAAVCDILSSVPVSLRNTLEEIDDNVISAFWDQGLKTDEATLSTIDEIFSSVETIDLGGALSYPLWMMTRGKLSYDVGQHVALILMTQVMEFNLMKDRIIGSDFVLTIGRK